LFFQRFFDFSTFFQHFTEFVDVLLVFCWYFAGILMVTTWLLMYNWEQNMILLDKVWLRYGF